MKIETNENWVMRVMAKIGVDSVNKTFDVNDEYVTDPYIKIEKRHYNLDNIDEAKNALSQIEFTTNNVRTYFKVKDIIQDIIDFVYGEDGKKKVSDYSYGNKNIGDMVHIMKHRLLDTYSLINVDKIDYEIVDDELRINWDYNLQKVSAILDLSSGKFHIRQLRDKPTPFAIRIFDEIEEIFKIISSKINKFKNLNMTVSSENEHLKTIINLINTDDVLKHVKDNRELKDLKIQYKDKNDIFVDGNIVLKCDNIENYLLQLKSMIGINDSRELDDLITAYVSAHSDIETEDIDMENINKKYTVRNWFDCDIVKNILKEANILNVDVTVDGSCFIPNESLCLSNGIVYTAKTLREELGLSSKDDDKGEYRNAWGKDFKGINDTNIFKIYNDAYGIDNKVLIDSVMNLPYGCQIATDKQTIIYLNKSTMKWERVGKINFDNTVYLDKVGIKRFNININSCNIIDEKLNIRIYQMIVDDKLISVAANAMRISDAMFKDKYATNFPHLLEITTNESGVTLEVSTDEMYKDIADIPYINKMYMYAYDEICIETFYRTKNLEEALNAKKNTNDN